MSLLLILLIFCGEYELSILSPNKLSSPPYNKLKSVIISIYIYGNKLLQVIENNNL